MGIEGVAYLIGAFALLVAITAPVWYPMVESFRGSDSKHEERIDKRRLGK